MTSTENKKDEWLIPKSDISFEYLKRFNRNMGLLHLVQGLLMVFLGFLPQLSYSNDVYTFYLEFQYPIGVVPNPEVIFTFTALGAFVGSFLLMSAAAHLLIAYPLNKIYMRNLKKGINKVRWFEYALSSSVMIVLIAMFFGVLDFWALFMIFISNALMNMFGLMMELHNVYTREKGEKVRWTAFYLGVIAGAVPWIVITAYFVNTSVIGGEIPWFVYMIYFIELAFFNSFAINMILQYKGVGKWKDYLYGERVYQVLSLIAKTFLAWLVFAGVFSPTG
ncbi:MAG: heliorhodopsin HeR [Candidatus Lokiarchaeota archaeon]|nr:heliorhodopsin HeR [Candidatus Lokiarchaeota archaeon]